MIALAPVFLLAFCILEAVCECPAGTEEKHELCKTVAGRSKIAEECPNHYCGYGQKCNIASRRGQPGYDPHSECHALESEITSGYCYPAGADLGYRCMEMRDGFAPSKYVDGKCVTVDASHGVCGKIPCPAGKFGSKTYNTEPKDQVWYPEECRICPGNSFSPSSSAYACQCPPHGHEAYAPNPDFPDLKTAYRDCLKGWFNDRMYTNLASHKVTDWRPSGKVGNKNFREGTPCGKCERCPLHSFSSGEASNVHCDCPELGHRANANRTGMEQCPAGYYQDEKIAWSRDVTCPTCKPCSDWEKGSYASNPGQEKCKCPKAGYEADQDGKGEIPCELGHFKEMGNCAFCQACSGGFFASHTGATECSAPKQGYYSDDGTSEKACSVGTFKKGAGRATKCNNCQSGKFQSTEGSPECSNATLGHEPYSKSDFAIRSGLSDDQRGCKPGYHQDQKGSMDPFAHVYHPSNCPPTRLHT